MAWEMARAYLVQHLEQHPNDYALSLQSAQLEDLADSFLERHDLPAEVTAPSLGRDNWLMLWKNVMRAIRAVFWKKQRQAQSEAEAENNQRQIETDDDEVIELSSRSLRTIAEQSMQTAGRSLDGQTRTASVAVQTHTTVMKDKSTQIDCYCVNCKKFHFCE